MRTTLISLAAAASALAFASPAAAQYYPAPPPPGHGYGYGYGHGNYGHVRSLQARVDQLQRHINRLDRRDVIREREADRLRSASRNIERRLHLHARNGLSRREAYDIEHRIAQLEHRIAMVRRDGHRWGRNDRRWHGFWADYDRGDRWDRDDDRRDRDGRRDGRRDRD